MGFRLLALVIAPSLLFSALVLAAANQVQEAQTQFEEVIRLRPDHVLARLSFGVALVRRGFVRLPSNETAGYCSFHKSCSNCYKICELRGSGRRPCR